MPANGLSKVSHSMVFWIGDVLWPLIPSTYGIWGYYVQGNKDLRAYSESFQGKSLVSFICMWYPTFFTCSCIEIVHDYWAGIILIITFVQQIISKCSSQWIWKNWTDVHNTQSVTINIKCLALSVTLMPALGQSAPLSTRDANYWRLHTVLPLMIIM